MTAGSKRLIKAGFTSNMFKSFKAEIEAKAKKQGKKPEELLSEELETLDPAKLESFANHDSLEVVKDQLLTVDFPKPLQKYYLVYETPHEAIEPLYYSVIQTLGSLGYPKILKITDLFTASEHSSFWGSAAQRLGIQQDKVMTFLATIGKLVKDLFQLVREMRWIDERLSFYEGVKKGSDAAEITLKGIWVDLVDGVGPGGQKNNQNLFLMQTQLQFQSLPDYFFATHPKELEDVDKIVDGEKDSKGKVNPKFPGLPCNDKVKEVLKRKLYQYISWRKATYDELIHRRKFTLHYLRQHNSVIKMYMNWVKPYLKAVERLQGNTARLDSPEIVAAFESSLVDIEVLALQMPSGNKKTYSCMLITFEYRSRPTMQFQQEYAHKGPLHLGETRICWRAYTWTWDEVQKYIAMKSQEDYELLAALDSSLEEAMKSLGGKLQEYLNEETARIEPKEEEKKKPEVPNLLEPFIEVAKGFKELGAIFVPAKKSESKDNSEEGTNAKVVVTGTTWNSYKLFKKGHGLVTW